MSHVHFAICSESWIDFCLLCVLSYLIFYFLDSRRAGILSMVGSQVPVGSLPVLFCPIEIWLSLHIELAEASYSSLFVLNLP